MVKIRTAILALAAAVATVLSLQGCKKTGPALFAGNYSFKTSGYLVVSDGSDEFVTIDLTPESGQMDIISSGEDGEVVITMNIIGGDMIVYRAKTDGDILMISGQQRRIALTGTHHIGLTVDVRGTAEKLGDSVIMDLKYDGSYTFEDNEFVISDSNVCCRAKLNED